MKGIIETSIYLIIFALVCFFSIDFIRINQRVSDAGEISQYVENYIEAYCGDVPDKNYPCSYGMKSLICYHVQCRKEE